MARKKTSVALDAETTDWLSLEPGSASEAIERLVKDEINRRQEADLAEQVRLKKLKPRDRYLAAVKANFHERYSLQVANVTQSQLDKWAEDESFVNEFSACQLDYLEALERRIASGLVTNSAVVTGLIAILNNNHPQYGFSRSKFMTEVFEPLFGALLKIVKEEVSSKSYSTINEKFQAVSEVRLSRFG